MSSPGAAVCRRVPGSELAAAARIILMPPSPPVEAQGWIINAKGEVELVANSALVVPYSPGGAPICN
ncbi:hypothetical protein QUB56_01075 [Microcoleus sp. AR_TQ3_B6]|uniref:hypothetical protein n=1 Tax=Microcoleus sp. AR_TQ3_B6 TaxID=3055284 RepID=UPI002FD6DDDA